MEIASDGDDSDCGPRISSKLKWCCCPSLLLFVVLICAMRTVPPAHLGVVTTFGAVSQSTLGAGLHFVNPFSSVVKLNLKTQLLYSENIVPTQEGLSVELDVAVLYHLDPKSVRQLYLTLGTEYESTLIMPEMQSAVRGLTSEGVCSLN